MRSIAIALSEKLGTIHTKEINYFVSEQFQRTSITEGVKITLKDADAETIIRLITSSITQLNLTTEDVFKHMIVVPYISSACIVEPAIEFKSNIYKQLLENIANVSIELIKESDAYTFSGKNKHVIYKKGGGNDEIIGGFINGVFIESNKPFSVLIKGDEWFESMSAIIDNKYNGTIVDDDDWEKAVMEGILYRRLSDEIAGTFLGEFEPDKERKFRLLQEFGSDMFNNVSEVGGKIYSSYGQLIGTSFRKFSAKDKVTQAQNLNGKDISHKHLKVVVNNKSGKGELITDIEVVLEKDVFEDWGSF